MAEYEVWKKTIKSGGTAKNKSKAKSEINDDEETSIGSNERENELLHNRTKCKEHNHMMALIREKMSHTNEVMNFYECDLGDTEIDFLMAREELSSVKRRRDKLRWLLVREKIKAGLLTRKDLLRDFEDATDEVAFLREKKKRLEAQIANAIEQFREARRMQLIN